MSRKLFGTDGIRGPVGGPLVNEASFARLGRALRIWFREQAGIARPSVIIGRDTRSSGQALARAFAAGIGGDGASVRICGILPTPAIARRQALDSAHLGVAVTASHNPASDNGIKFFGPAGRKFDDAEQSAIERIFEERTEPQPVSGHPDIGTTSETAGYIEEMAAGWPLKSLKGWKIVVDTAHGATTETTPAVLQRLGAEVVPMGAAPDGLNINAGVGSEHPEALAARVVESQADLGVAHDGDGDRAVFCDRYGTILSGETVITILARFFHRRSDTGSDEIITTIVSNGALESILAPDIRVRRVDVGDRHVSAGMRETGARFGAESSGHYVFSENLATGDGLAGLLHLLQAILTSGRSLGELASAYRPRPQGVRSLPVSGKPPLSDLPSFSAQRSAIEQSFGERGRLLLRYSGTEPKIRLLAEHEDPQQVEEALRRIQSALREDGILA